LRSEIDEVEPLEVKIQAGRIVRPEDGERVRETEGTTNLPKRKIRKSQAKVEPISKFRNELRRHSNARKRTDLAYSRYTETTERSITGTSHDYQRLAKTSNADSKKDGYS
jgi:hypothetical protein